jgi:ribosomal protein S18 acetylase RimI-like enzyme
MAVDLTRLNTSVNTPPGFTIATVADTDALRAWAHIITTSYDLPASSEKQLRELMIGLGLDGPIRNYLGYLDGKPVATSQLFVAAGVGGIMFVATLPEARGQGIGAAITLAPLLEARHMGYRIGVLQSSDMGFRIYRRLGFEVVCRMEHFSWMEGARSEA